MLPRGDANLTSCLRARPEAGGSAGTPETVPRTDGLRGCCSAVRAGSGGWDGRKLAPTSRTWKGTGGTAAALPLQSASSEASVDISLQYATPLSQSRAAAPPRQVKITVSGDWCRGVCYTGREGSVLKF